MPYIYCITNDINDKKYVGKTSLKTIEERFYQHIEDSKRPHTEKRALYDAMLKYGYNHFSISLLETVETEEQACEQEQYWIKKLNTYHNGYNMTYGGDGKRLYDYKELAEAYKKYKSVKKVAEIFNCDEKPIRLACKENNVEIEIAPNKKRIKRIDLKTGEEKIYNSITDAAKDIPNKQPETARKNISRGLNTNRLAYGYKFEYI